MHLKRLEAFGFKSFADKVVFDFEPGMTVFVGPNGCGKSNVVDSIKWVLGDQSAKSLRGSEMLDVIFNGSANRKPLNLAEVTLTFDNDEKTLPIDAPEVSVTRRLYRSGESEYLINKALCRLRDIRELFWDTGVGTSSYSIIEQGRIGTLIEANVKERRAIFEEAAGIHKYKERKKVAMRRLDRAELNLSRVKDFVGEIERNLKSVVRQAGKARRAKEIGDRLRDIRLEILLHETSTSETSLREIESALAGAKEQTIDLSSKLGGAEKATLEEQESMDRIDRTLTEAQQKLSAVRANLAGLEEAIRSEQRAIEEMVTETERSRNSSKEAGARAASVAQEREKAELDLVVSKETLAHREQSVQTLNEALDSEIASYQTTVRSLEEARKEAIDTLGRRSQSQQLLSQAEAEVAGVDYRLRSSRAEVSKAEDQLRFAQEEAAEARSRSDQVRKRCDTLETEQTGIRNLQLRTEDEMDRISIRAQELRNTLEKCRSRRAVLEDLNESGEGLSSGVRAVLNELRSAWSDNGDLFGLVADCLGVDPRFERAMEAALAGHIEALVVSDSATARRLLGRLRDEGLGRATFLPLDRIEETVQRSPLLPIPNEAALQEQGLIGRGSDLVVCESLLLPIAHALLGKVLVFETTEQAERAHYILPTGDGWRCVSLGGEILEAFGAVSGGKHRIDRLGLIGRRNEITRLDAQEDDFRLKIEALEERIAFLEKRAQQLARDDDRLAQNLTALAATSNELQGLLAAIAREESRSAEERQVAADEIRELEAERKSHGARIKELGEGLERLKVKEREVNQQVEVLSTQLTSEEEIVSTRRTSLEEIKRDVSALTVKVEGLTRHEQSLSSQFAEWRDEAEREQCRADALEDRRKANEEALQDKEKQFNEATVQVEELDTSVQTLSKDKETSRLRFEDSRGLERALSSQLDQARTQASEIERKQLELKMALEQHLSIVRKEYDEDASQLLADRGHVPEVTQEMRDEADKLDSRLQKLGPVNMYALEEQKQLEKRFEFYKGQAEDLESARSSVKDVIARINRRSRKQFQETFEAVKGNFSEIFRKLFGGGRADLIIEEGEDILEAGIEIRARPPGKEPRSIMQLSGGEKAMTTIALLFAVFRSRPAPFCILDEVDAPLDEANVDRFNMIIQEFMDKSQFVVITHNKKTMQYGSVLYGVTMPEPGVSKKIAVKFENIEEHIPMDEITGQSKRDRDKGQLFTDDTAPTIDVIPETEAVPSPGGGGD